MHILIVSISYFLHFKKNTETLFCNAIPIVVLGFFIGCKNIRIKKDENEMNTKMNSLGI